MRPAALLVTACLSLVACGGVARAVTLQVDPSNLGSVFGSAQAGDVIELASGSYSFGGGSKPGVVTLRPASGATPTMRATFHSSSNIRLEGITMSGLGISGATHDIAVVDGRFTGQAYLNVSGSVGADIVLAGNRFEPWSVGGGDAEGRLHITQPGALGSAPVGVTVSNNLFVGPGCSDGIQIGAYGVVVEGNVFAGIRQGSCAAHVDSVQLYGQSHTTIAGNYFSDFSVAIMAPDGGRGERIVNNVIDQGAGQRGAAVQLGGFREGSLFAHNSVRGTDVFADGASITLRDNLMLGTQFRTGGCRPGDVCTIDNNLFTSSPQGSRAHTGSPSFAGGPNPDSYPDWALAPGSPGKHAASDGTDIGINLDGAPPPPPPGKSPGATGHRKPLRVIARKWRYRPRVPRVGRRIVLDATRSKSKGGRCTWILKRKRRHGCKVAVRFRKPGGKRITLEVRYGSGLVATRTRVVRVRPRPR
jgi:hypothetical protein